MWCRVVSRTGLAHHPEHLEGLNVSLGFKEEGVQDEWEGVHLMTQAYVSPTIVWGLAMEVCDVKGSALTSTCIIDASPPHLLNWSPATQQIPALAPSDLLPPPLVLPCRACPAATRRILPRARGTG